MRGEVCWFGSNLKDQKYNKMGFPRDLGPHTPSILEVWSSFLN